MEVIINLKYVNGLICTRNEYQGLILSFNDAKKGSTVYGKMFGSKDSCSHYIKDMWIEKDILKAKIFILGTYDGNIVRELYKDGIPIEDQIDLDLYDPYMKIRLRKKKLERIHGKES